MYFLTILSVLTATSEACSGLYARGDYLHNRAVAEWGYNADDGAMMWYNMDPVKNKLVSSMETELLKRTFSGIRNTNFRERSAAEVRISHLSISTTYRLVWNNLGTSAFSKSYL